MSQYNNSIKKIPTKINQKPVVEALYCMDSADLCLGHVPATDLLCGPKKMIANLVPDSLNPLKIPLTDLVACTLN